MTYVLLMHGVILGRSELESADPSTGMASGIFRPGMGYDLVQPVFQLHAESVRDGVVMDAAKLARYEKACAALALRLVDSAGAAVAAEAIRVSELPGGKVRRIEARITDPRYWSTR